MQLTTIKAMKYFKNFFIDMEDKKVKSKEKTYKVVENKYDKRKHSKSKRFGSDL